MPTKYYCYVFVRTLNIQFVALYLFSTYFIAVLDRAVTLGILYNVLAVNVLLCFIRTSYVHTHTTRAAEPRHRGMQVSRATRVTLMRA